MGESPLNALVVVAVVVERSVALHRKMDLQQQQELFEGPITTTTC